MRYNWHEDENEGMYIARMGEYNCILQHNDRHGCWEVELTLVESGEIITRLLPAIPYGDNPTIEEIQDQAQTVCEKVLTWFFDKMEKQLKKLGPTVKSIKEGGETLPLTICPMCDGRIDYRGNHREEFGCGCMRVHRFGNESDKELKDRYVWSVAISKAVSNGYLPSICERGDLSEMLTNDNILKHILLFVAEKINSKE